MKTRVTLCRVGLLCGMSWAAVGCGDAAPPFDDLPLRDALRAEPAVIAALPDDLRSRLAARLQAARTADESSDVVESLDSPSATIASLDAGRQLRQADALVAGEIASDRVVRVFDDAVEATAPAAPGLPPLEGQLAGSTASLEARALDGAAGATLRALMSHTRTRRLVRVVGWPVGAIALGDAVYVDAAWLVALAPGSSDGGAAGASGSMGTAPAGGAPRFPSALTASADAGRQDGGRDASGDDADTMADGGAGADAGLPQLDGSIPGFLVDAAAPPPSPVPPTSSGAGSLDGCGAGADSCASSGDSCDSEDDDACSSSDDGCDNQDDQGDACSGGDGTDDSCTPPPDDSSNCRVAPGRGRRRATLLWVLGPLGFLTKRRP